MSMSSNWQDPRSYGGQFAAGAPVYNGGSYAAQSGGGPQYGAPQGDLSQAKPDYQSIKYDPYNQSSTQQQDQSSQAPPPPYQSQYDVNFNPNLTPIPGAATLPYDDVYASTIRGLQSQYAQSMYGFQNQAQQAQNTYNTGVDSTQQAGLQGQRQWEAQAADQGLTHSGANIYQQGQLSLTTQKQLEQLAAQQAQSQVGVQQGEAMLNSNAIGAQSDAFNAMVQRFITQRQALDQATATAQGQAYAQNLYGTPIQAQLPVQAPAPPIDPNSYAQISWSGFNPLGLPASQLQSQQVAQANQQLPQWQPGNLASAYLQPSQIPTYLSQDAIQRALAALPPSQ